MLSRTVFSPEGAAYSDVLFLTGSQQIALTVHEINKEVVTNAWQNVDGKWLPLKSELRLMGNINQIDPLSAFRRLVVLGSRSGLSTETLTAIKQHINANSRLGRKKVNDN